MKHYSILPCLLFLNIISPTLTDAFSPLSTNHHHHHHHPRTAITMRRDCFSRRKTTTKTSSSSSTTSHDIRMLLLGVRGGSSSSSPSTITDDESSSTTSSSPSLSRSSSLSFINFSVLASFGKIYASYIDTHPILTKSLTAGIIFGLSDHFAQKIEKTTTLSTKRTISSILLGLLYFGPAAHAWYDAIFYYLPSTSLSATLLKAALGQLIFGPLFTIIFFGVSLLTDNIFSFGDWGRKIKQDLPGAWVAGLGFWPVVDFVSYKMIKPDYIPLFVNFCSFVWTIYLSIVANRRGGAGEGVL